MSDPSFFGKLITGPRESSPASYSAFFRERIWSFHDLAVEVNEGRLVVDPNERLPLTETTKTVSMVEALLTKMPTTIGVAYSRNAVVSEATNDLITYLFEQAELSEDEVVKVIRLAASRGAEKAFLKMVSDWPSDQLLELASEPYKVTAVAIGELTWAHSLVHAGHHQIVRAFLSAGLDPNIRTHAGGTLAHWTTVPDILEDLKKSGLDPEAVDTAGRTAPAHWGLMHINAASQKALSSGWAKQFSVKLKKGEIDGNAVAVLLDKIHGKTKMVLQEQISKAGLTAASVVNGKNLAEIASASLLLSSTDGAPYPAAYKLLLDKAPPSTSSYSNAWLMRVALGAKVDASLDQPLSPPEFELRGPARLDKVLGALQALVSPADLPFALNKRINMAVHRTRFNGEDRDIKVSNPELFRWLAQTDETGRPRIASIYAANPRAPRDLFRQAAKLAQENGYRFVPGTEEDWLELGMATLRSNETSPGGGPGMNSGAREDLPSLSTSSTDQMILNLVTRLWDGGIRPRPESLPVLIEHATQYQPALLPYLEQRLLDNTVAAAPRAPTRGMRL